MKDPLFGNKVAAAVLVTLLLAFGVPIILTTFDNLAHHGHGDHGDENPFGLAYIPAEISLGPGAGAGEEEQIDLGTLMAEASVERGERAAGLCGSCHTFGQGEPNGIGPNLWNIVGRDVGGVSGFGYSSALASLGGAWTYERLDPYLENSQAYVPGTQMAQMVRKDGKRADILAYLGSLSDNPVPFPEPAPAAPAEGEGDDMAENEAAAPTSDDGELQQDGAAPMAPAMDAASSDEYQEVAPQDVGPGEAAERAAPQVPGTGPTDGESN